MSRGLLCFDEDNKKKTRTQRYHRGHRGDVSVFQPDMGVIAPAWANGVAMWGARPDRQAMLTLEIRWFVFLQRTGITWI